MSFPSPGTKSGGSSIPIGFPVVMPHGRNPTVTLGDGSVLLRSGLLVPPSTYPKAALCEHLQVIGTGTGSLTPGTVINDICTDGGGLNYLIAYNDNTNNMYTTDGGLTWNTVAHGLGQGCHTVCYGNGYWLAGGTTAVTRKISRSTTINGTYTVVDTTSSLTNTNNSGVLIYTGGANFAFIAQGTVSNNCAFSSNSGGTWVSKSWATVININSAKVAISADGAGKVLACYGSTVVPQYSTDYGATWQNGTANAGANFYYGSQYYNGQFYFLSGAGQFDISTNGSTITTGPTIPAGSDAAPANSAAGALQIIGGKLCFLITDQSGIVRGLTMFDGTNFKSKQIRATWSGSNSAFCGSTNGAAVAMVGTSSFVSVQITNIAGVDYVGTIRDQQIGYGSSTPATAGHCYIKVAG